MFRARVPLLMCFSSDRLTCPLNSAVVLASYAVQCKSQGRVMNGRLVLTHVSGRSSASSVWLCPSLSCGGSVSGCPDSSFLSLTYRLLQCRAVALRKVVEGKSVDELWCEVFSPGSP